MVFMHTYTFRDYPVERALRKAREYGYDGVELSPCHWGWSQGAMAAHLEESFAMADRLGVPIQAVDFGGEFLHADPAVRRQAVADVAGLMRHARRLGATMVNGGCGAVVGASPSHWEGNGSAAATEAHWTRAGETFRQVAEVAGELDMLVTLEIHMNALHDTAASTIRLLEQIGSPQIKAALDAGNMLPLKRAEKAPEAVRLLGGHLGYVHLKNCKLSAGGEADYAVGLADGHLDFYAVALALKEIGYSGPYCIEYCGKGDASPRAAADLPYWKGLLAEAGAGA